MNCLVSFMTFLVSMSLAWDGVIGGDSDYVIAIIGGARKSSSSDVELYEPDKQTTCKDIKDYVFGSDSSGMFLNGKLVMCGGYENIADCYRYSKNPEAWEKIGSLGRGVFASETCQWFKDNKRMWVTGGTFNIVPGDKSTMTQSDKTYIVNVDTGDVQEGPDLPEGRSMHNIIRLDDDSAILIGSDLNDKKVWMFTYSEWKKDSNKGWTKLPDAQEARSDGVAGLVRHNNKKYIVLAGGENITTTEIYDIDAETWSWGPKLDRIKQQQDACVVQLDGSFMIFGGLDRDESGGANLIKRVYKFEMNDTSSAWVQQSKSLKAGRRWCYGVRIPKDYLDC